MIGTNRAKVTFLELVIPPISNQEAVWFKDEPFAEHMKQSDFYMIGGKAKSKFSNIRANEDNSQILFDVFVGDDNKSSGTIHRYKLEAVIDFEGNDFDVSYGDEAIEFFYENVEKISYWLGLHQKTSYGIGLEKQQVYQD